MASDCMGTSCWIFFDGVQSSIMKPHVPIIIRLLFQYNHVLFILLNVVRVQFVTILFVSSPKVVSVFVLSSLVCQVVYLYII